MKTYGIRLGIVAVLAVAAFAVKVMTGDTDLAEAGDCIADADRAEDMKIVECGDAEAAFKVEGIVDGVKESDLDTNKDICKAYPKTTQGLWQGEKGATGEMLCLSPIK